MAQLLGYYFIMIVLVVLGVVFAKKKAGWILYGIGAVLQAISLFGMKAGGADQSELLVYYVCYVVILVVGWLAISAKSKKD